MNLSELYIVKSRTGHYKDNAENRRLHRVGQRYGSKSEATDADTTKDSKTSRIEGATKAFKAVLALTDNWEEEDWFDVDKLNAFSSKISAVISKFKLTEKEFYEATDYKKIGEGFDLVYTDYIAESKIRDQLDRLGEAGFDEFDNYDHEAYEKVEGEVLKELAKIVGEYDVLENEWDVAVAPYMDSFAGLDYKEVKRMSEENKNNSK